jgi:hypothetical protein
MAPRQPRVAASNSFTPDEVRVLDYILTRMRLGSEHVPVTRHPAYISLCRKAQAMKRVVKKRQSERKLAELTDPPDD